MKSFEFMPRYGGRQSAVLEIGNYTHGGGVAISLWAEEYECYEPWADLTVNLTEPAAEGCAYIDTNNFPEAVAIMEENGFGYPTGRSQWSGYCLYPEYSLNMDVIREYEMKEE